MYRRVRSAQYVVGYGYPAYASEAAVRPLPGHPSRPTHRTPLPVTGRWDKATVRRLQEFTGVPAAHLDGIRGPETNRHIQRCLHRVQDGVMSRGDWAALQRKIGAKADGTFGAGCVRYLQRYLNRV